MTLFFKFILRFEPCHENTYLLGYQMVNGLTFRIKEVDGFYYVAKRGADQMHVYHAADLHLFHIRKKQVFS